MKPLPRIFAALLPLLAAPGAAAVPYPTEQQFRDAIREVAWVAAAENMKVEALDAQKEGLARPFMSAGLSLVNGHCMVFYNTRAYADLTPFFERMPEEDLPVWLRTMAVHEMTHCIEQREAFVHRRFERALPPRFAGRRMTVQGYLSDVKTREVSLWQESLADIAAVLYLREAQPLRWREFAQGLARLRGDLADKHPAHATSGWLLPLIADPAPRAPGQGLFDAAFQYRSRLGPR